MLVENTHAMKEFLMCNLSKLCNADPAALTKYVLALLKKNRPENELKAFLLDQLDVFLLKQTPGFVDLLLKALKTKAYIESAHVSPEREVAPNNDSSWRVTSDTSTRKPGKVVDSNLKGEGDSTHTHIENTKATPDVCVSSREYEKRSKTPPPLSPKIRGNAHQDLPQVMSISETSLLERESNVKERNIQTVGSEKSVPRSNFIKRCENYDKLGYCLKGSLCAFDHGCDPILVEDVCALSLNHNFTVCAEERESPFVCEVKPDQPKSPLPPLPTTSPPPLPPLPPVYPPPPEPYNPECPAITSYYPAFCMPTLQSGPQRIKTIRTRELIGVPTHNNTEKNKEKRKPFDFSRLGPPPKKLANDSSILEIRKIPSNLNTISMLNRHFSEFGRIVNIEVAYEGDPEGALIKFASPMEAAAAFRSSVAIFNNRFIKVFYHGTHRNLPHSQIPKQTETTLESGSNFGVLEKKSSERDSAGNSVSRRGEIYIPTYNTPTERVFQKSPLFSPENHLREVKKESNPKVEKQLDLLRKKQDFLNCSINHQKIILAKLLKSKKKKEKEFLKKTIDQISSKISTLKTEIEKEADGLKQQLMCVGKISKSLASKSEKELLDAEMDIYKEKKTKITLKSKETAKLLSQVNVLKEKAKSLGFIEGSLHAPSSHAGATHALALSKVKKPSVHGISRPKRQVLVCSTKDQEELLKHFEQFGPVENIEDKNGYKLVTFSSRSAAEAAFSHKIDDIHLVWFQDSQLSIENMDQSADSSESKPINSEILGDDEEEEDEEDSEARSWRR